jgi:hypothetical protein
MHGPARCFPLDPLDHLGVVILDPAPERWAGLGGQRRLQALVGSPRDLGNGLRVFGGGAHHLRVNAVE